MTVVIVNGACGVGKSTIAARIHEYLELSFLLDIDSQRRFFSHYREKKEESAQASRVLALAILSSCLSAGYDVVIDKMIFDSKVIDAFYEIANKRNAKVIEIILWAPKEVAMQRAEKRGWRDGGLLTPEKVLTFWEKINELKKQRSCAIILDTSSNSEDETFSKIKSILMA